jgi:hypothetical protein
LSIRENFPAETGEFSEKRKPNHSVSEKSETEKEKTSKFIAEVGVRTVFGCGTKAVTSNWL